MKKIFLILVFVLPFYDSYGQERDNLENHQLSVDFGSLRNRYVYPINNIRYTSKLFTKVNLKFSARLRSYGTLFFYSKSAYDLTPQIEYYFTKKIKPIYFSIGIGLDGRIRLIRDERSNAINSAEHFMNITLHGNYKKLNFNMPLWTRFYKNGIAFTLLPEISYRVNNTISLFLRYELSHLSIYNKSTHEWRQDSFVGTTILF